MNKKFVGSCAVVFLLGVLSSPAFAKKSKYSEPRSFNFSAFLGPGISSPLLNDYVFSITQRREQFSDFDIGFGGGLAAEYKFNSSFGIELGMVYFMRRWDQQVDTINRFTNALDARSNFTVTTHNLLFPLLIRYWIADYFSLGGGFYFSAGLGNIRSNGTTVTGAAQVPFNTTTSLTNATETDYGVTLSFKGAYPPVESFPDLKIIGDLRGLFGLDNNQDVDGSASRTVDIMLLLGAQYSI